MITTVKIGALQYDVKETVDLKRVEDGAMLYGYIHHLTQQIEVEKEMTAPIQKIALLHEILHGIIHQSGIISDDEEQFIIAISHGLYALLRDNPHVIQYIVETTL